jgi:hypothetical protein
MTVPLELRRREPGTEVPTAWFIPGASAAHWLDVLVAGQLTGPDSRLFVVPGSVSGGGTLGLLVILPIGQAGKSLLTAVGCRCLADRLYLPLDAQPYPPVTEAEIRDLCRFRWAFLHPVAGLSGFEEESSLSVDDLLEAPVEIVESWNSARAGEPRLPTLAGVRLISPPRLDDMLGGAVEGIAQQPPSTLPPAPAEPKDDAVSRGRRELESWLARGVSQLVNRLPDGASRRTWADELGDWAQRRLQGVSHELDQIRNRELHRLLHLLETNPELGLRHAIPLGGAGHRGLTPPGGKLGDRAPEFDANRLGGGPADAWDIPLATQERLRTRYRELANQELRLGRHRRAAYLFAELLGDFVSAAATLKQGRDFRAAALIYEVYLRNPLEAARCLAEGGLLPEAVERFEKLELWLEAADLHELLGRPAAARAAIERVVAKQLLQHDVAGAFRLICERLHEPDRALALALAGWPDAPYAVTGLGLAFQHWRQRHEGSRVAAWLDQHTEALLQHPSAAAILQLLFTEFSQATEPALRRQAADLSRRLIASQLSQPGLTPAAAGGWVDGLTRLTSGDRLLIGDVQRFKADQANRLKKHKLLPAPPMPGVSAELHRVMRLSPQGDWIALLAQGSQFFAACVTPTRLELIRGNWQGRSQRVGWDIAATAVRHAGLQLEAVTPDGKTVLVRVGGNSDLAPRRFPATDAFDGVACEVEVPSWLPKDRLPLAFGVDCLWTGQVLEAQAILSCHDRTGRLLQTVDVTTSLLKGGERTEATRLCLGCSGNQAAIALGNRLVLVSGPHESVIELSGQVTRLVPTPRHTRRGWIVLRERGAELHWIDAPGSVELNEELECPLATWVPGGPLVLAAGREIVLLTLEGSVVRRSTRQDGTHPQPIGLCSTDQVGEFATLSADGHLAIYRCLSI